MTTIELDGLRKEFDGVTAVKGIDLSVRSGEFLVIVGPSGCGKSTTLRTIAGLEQPTDGDVIFADETVTDVDPKNRDVAMVFQNYALFPHMSARRNMSFGADSATGMSSDEIEDRVETAAETLDIQELLERRPESLSGGEQQRVAVGRALVRDPEVLLMDEPLSNLDAKLRTEMRTELQALHAEHGRTTVYVTHDQTEAMTLGDRVAVMRDGSIQQVDDPQTLYDYPANEFVARFLGNPSMNLVPVSVEKSADGTAVASHPEFSVELPGTAGDKTASKGTAGDKTTSDESKIDDGDTALLGIRPEDIHPVDGVEHAHRSPLELTVNVTESVGDTRYVYGDIENTEMTVAIDPHRNVVWGDTLTLAFDPDRVHLFEEENGEAVYHGAQGSGSASPQGGTVTGAPQQ